MNDCKHKFVKEVEGVYIPDYYAPDTTSGSDCGCRIAKVKQWECLICGARLGYLNEDQIVVDINCLKKLKEES